MITAMFDDDGEAKEFGIALFLAEIDELCRDKEVTFMDAVLHYCEKNNIEIESVAAYIRKNVVLKARLQEEAEILNYMPKTTRLPI